MKSRDPDELCKHLIADLRDGEGVNHLHGHLTDMELEWPRCSDAALGELLPELKRKGIQSNLYVAIEKELQKGTSEFDPEKIAIIVPVFYKNDHKSHLRAGCFDRLMETLAQQDYPADLVHVILLDNSSPNRGMIHDILKRHSVQYVLNKKNYGYASACNWGMKEALSRDFSLFLLMNDDVYFNSTNVLSEMVRVSQLEKTGAVGSRCAVPQGEGYIIREGVVGMGVDCHVPDITKLPAVSDRSKPISFVDGCSMLLRKEHLDAVGFMDEDYFMYFEETDYCVRLARKGFINRLCLRCRVTHEELGGGLFHPKSGKYFVRNCQVFADKHLRGFRARWIWTTWMLKEFCRWTIQSVKDPYRSCTHSRLRIILGGVIGYLWGVSRRIRRK